MDTSKIDRYIRDNFTASYMSNAKWEKLILNLTNSLDTIYFDFKHVCSDEIESNSLSYPDMFPYFIEPVMYKEIEWISFPDKYEEYISKDNLKAGMRFFGQDIEKIKKVIEETGQFAYDVFENSIKLYAYKR